jgi:hypothetical protein
MSALPDIIDPDLLKLEFRRLIQLRESGKQPRPRGKTLTNEERLLVHAKSDGRYLNPD